MKKKTILLLLLSFLLCTAFLKAAKTLSNLAASPEWPTYRVGYQGIDDDGSAVVTMKLGDADMLLLARESDPIDDISFVVGPYDEEKLILYHTRSHQTYEETARTSDSSSIRVGQSLEIRKDSLQAWIMFEHARRVEEYADRVSNLWTVANEYPLSEGGKSALKALSTEYAENYDYVMESKTLSVFLAMYGNDRRSESYARYRLANLLYEKLHQRTEALKHYSLCLISNPDMEPKKRQFAMKRIARTILAPFHSEDGKNPIDARAELDELHITYSRDEFVEHAGRGDVSVIDLFLAAGMNPDAKDENGDTALFEAVSGGHIEVAQYLLDKGANVNEKTEDGFTPLIIAAVNGQTAMVRELIGKGADVNAKSMYDETALTFAAANGYSDIVRLLKEAGAEQ